jgi:hypothetical protein
VVTIDFIKSIKVQVRLVEMKRSFYLWLCVFVVANALLASCGGGKGGVNPLPPGTTAATLAELKAAVTTRVFATGNAPSRFALHDGLIYCVNSLANTLSVQSATDYSDVRALSLPVGSGPYDIAFSGDKGYICTNGTNLIHRFTVGAATLDAETVSLTDAVNGGYAFVGPGEMAVAMGKLYIPLSGIETFGDPAQDVDTIYGQGRVAVVNLNTFKLERFFEVEFANPTVSASGVGGALYVVCTGESQFHADWTPYAGSDGGLVIYDLNNDRAAYSINLGRTLPSAFIAFNSTEAYIGSNLNGEMYRVRLDTGVVMRGPDDPVELSGEFTFISGFIGLPGLGVLAGSFNTDEIYFIDPNGDEVSKAPFSEPLSFAESATFFGGVQDLTYFETDTAHKVFVLMGVANQVGLLDLTNLWDRIRLGSG